MNNFKFNYKYSNDLELKKIITDILKNMITTRLKEFKLWKI